MSLDQRDAISTLPLPVAQAGSRARRKRLAAIARGHVRYAQGTWPSSDFYRYSEVLNTPHNQRALNKLMSQLLDPHATEGVQYSITEVHSVLQKNFRSKRESFNRSPSQQELIKSTSYVRYHLKRRTPVNREKAAPYLVRHPELINELMFETPSPNARTPDIPDDDE
ncbi:hypothetical protein GGI12_004474 [Dipsacomyces acuminosporus]|nr:hypothetical protein GGI12_004474 [Dipsacomyces acuminosporus]